MQTQRNFTFIVSALSMGLSVLCATGTAAAQNSDPSAPKTVAPYLNPEVPAHMRAEDLVRRMTLPEKAAQMYDQAAAIPRLGVDGYNWRAAPAATGTHFPQPIGLAATWDEDLMSAVASALADESRARFHSADSASLLSGAPGLSAWSPNLNIVRDPRWGGGQNTFGEDPFLTGRMGVQFVNGLQGDDDTYLKTIATLKNFAVTSGPHASQHSDSHFVTDADLWESYLPAFKMAFDQTDVAAVTCSESAVWGVPACGNERLLMDLLRGDLRFGGLVVSECGAIGNIYYNDRMRAAGNAPHAAHAYLDTRAEAAALSVKMGTDLNCGDAQGNKMDALPAAVADGLIDERTIDKAVVRLYTALFKLGIYDDPALVPYAQTSVETVRSDANLALAEDTARKSLVLLKNDGVLPLAAGTRVAVIGPNADNRRALLPQSADPSQAVTPLQAITAKLGAGNVSYAKGTSMTGGADNATLRAEAMTAAANADVILMFGGIDTGLEGRNANTEAVGFSGGDRTDLNLPPAQADLLQALHATGKPVVLVNFSGGAMALNWEAENLPALVQAFYPGERAGHAIADLLWGEYSPSGRLPVTFYKSLEGLPAFDNYAMQGRTYKYFSDEVLYPFGHGLSYSSFKYSRLDIPRAVDALGLVPVHVTVKNTGQMTARDVVQVYLQHHTRQHASVPKIELIAFDVIELAPGQSGTASFMLRPEQMGWYNQDGRTVIPSGTKATLTVGGGQPGSQMSSKPVAKTITFTTHDVTAIPYATEAIASTSVTETADEIIVRIKCPQEADSAFAEAARNPSRRDLIFYTADVKNRTKEPRELPKSTCGN